MKVDLQTHRPGRAADRERHYWRQSAPFLFNPRGYLIHRVRYVQTITRSGRVSHFAFSFWCGNGTCNGNLLHEPPADRLLCAHCEANAVAHGMPSSEQLVGRHVHLGKLRAIRIC